ncbi:class I SAM-dependent methyltransferase [Candidatus Saccharibacteria bacterium]|nr:class I SAM-dependent methyltransferase [Candidatus Saccharibacteria bacterium]
MNTHSFTGKSQAYAIARPSYPDEAIRYIRSLVPVDAVFADIGAGTGKFSILIAKCGYEVFAVEPNADMREQLVTTLAPFPNARIVEGAAEASTLADSSIDVITCAQALGWFNLDKFKAECRRIGKPGAIVISIHNEMPGDDFVPSNNRLTNKRAAEVFFKDLVSKKFSNPISYTREKWLSYNASISDNPQPLDQGYEVHVTELNAIFDSENVAGLLRHNLITRVCSGII